MRVRVFFLPFLALALVLPTAQAQEWSPEQAQVWAAVQDLWEFYSTRDLDPWYDAISEEYRGWTWESPAPMTKAQSRRFGEVSVDMGRAVVYHIHPLAIDIHGDVAIVFYTYEMILEDADGVMTPETGKWTDVYRRVDGRWLLIADAGGSVG